MLVEFRVQNFRSFRGEQTLSMVAGKKDKSHPENIISEDLVHDSKMPLLKSAAIYGANASGKSNLVLALNAMEQFVRTSATKMTLGDSIEFASPYRLAVDTRDQPSTFEITVIVDEKMYRYGFSITRERVHEEWLFVRTLTSKRSPESKWFERLYDPKTKKESWSFGAMLKDESKLLRERTRENGLFLSRGADLNSKPLGPLFLWFQRGFWLIGLDLPRAALSQLTAKLISTQDDTRDEVLRLVRDADLGIEQVRVQEVTYTETLSSAIPAEMKAVMVRLAENPLSYEVTAMHKMHDSDEMVRFNWEEDESEGTRRYFALLGPVVNALKQGSLLVIDEIDCSMHPLLTRRMIEIFHSPELNKKGAQLIFTTHDSSLMDSSLFRRDQIWLTEKQQDNSTDLFSLYDFDTESRPRATEAFERNYLAGRYGAVPNFGPFLESMDVE